MKNKTLILVVTIFIAGITLNSCKSSADGAKEAKDKVVVAKQELNQALQDSILQFKKESEEKISNYEKDIAELKVKIAKEKKENKAKYEKKLAELEQKNADLKKKLENFKAEEKDKWLSFKTEFDHDMDGLGTAFKEFFTADK